MATDLQFILETISKSDGTVKLNDLAEEQIQKITDLIIYKYPTAKNPNNEVRFGDKVFSPKNKSGGIVVDSGNILIDYQVKSIMLIAMHVGLREGGEILKFSGLVQRARILLKFANFISKNYKLRSFFEFANMPALKSRTIVLDFLSSPKSRDGLENSSYPSNAKILLDSLKLLNTFHLANDDFLVTVREICSPRIKKAEDGEIRHSVIPTQVMKQIIKASTNYLNRCRPILPELTKILEATAKRINSSGQKFLPQRAGIRPSEKLSSLINEYFKDVRLHVMTLVLAYTGMRDNECLSLKNNSHLKRKEDGEWYYFVKAILKKTDEGEIELDWVANKEVYDAIELLSKINELNYHRAENILARFGGLIVHSRFQNFTDGLKNNFLFGCQLTTSVGFIDPDSTVKNSGLYLKKHQYRLSENDIVQLESLNCNNKSVSHVSGLRGVPYQVGDLFNLTSHQFRHTFAWFIIANRLGDLDDIKYQYKHLRESMALVYSERGYDSLSNLRSVIEYFEELLNNYAIENIIESATENSISGGGGQRLASIISKFNDGSVEAYFSNDDQPVFSDIQELIDFTTRHSNSVRGLPHGYCLKGIGCKIKNASDPSHCLYCDTYYVTPKHLPYWLIIKNSCEKKLRQLTRSNQIEENNIVPF